MGWSKEKPPEELSKKVEEPRASEERATLSRRDVNKWVEEWIKQNAGQENKKWHGVIRHRLRNSKNVLPWPMLFTLATVKGKAFTDAAALDAWLAENGIDGEAGKRIGGSPGHTCVGVLPHLSEGVNLVIPRLIG